MMYLPQGLTLFLRPRQHAALDKHEVNDEIFFFQLYRYPLMHFLCLNLCFGTKGRDITCLVEDTSRIPEESAEPPAVQQVSTSSLASTSKAKQEPQISSIPAGLPPQIEDTPKAKKEPQITSIPEGVPSQVEDTRKAKQEPQIPSIPAGLPSQVEDTLGECPR